jgi:GNAT superfamily N-acetyltransferase
VTVVAVTGADDLVRVHDRLLAPSFPAAELESVDDLIAAVRAGTSEVLVHQDRPGDPVAVAVADRSRAAPVVLLAYLATDPLRRSTGLGSSLLDAAMTRWLDRADPCLVLAEVEDPAEHPASAAHGDPAARLRFYARRGARALDLPYFQPRLRTGASRVPHLLLLVLHAAPSLVDGTAVLAAPLHAWLTERFRDSEGRLPADPEGQALLAAVEGGPPVPTRALT